MAIETRNYRVIDAEGAVVLDAPGVVNDLAVPHANNNLGWSIGSAPFRVFASIEPEGGKFGLLGEVAEGAPRTFADANLSPDFGVEP